MNSPVWAALLIAALTGSALYAYKKRKKAGIRGVKTALTSICFYLMGVVNLLAYWFDFVGIISWTLTLVLIILGIYFIKYLPKQM